MTCFKSMVVFVCIVMMKQASTQLARDPKAKIAGARIAPSDQTSQSLTLNKTTIMQYYGGLLKTAKQLRRAIGKDHIHVLGLSGTTDNDACCPTSSAWNYYLTMNNTKGDLRYIIGYSSDGRYQWFEEGVCKSSTWSYYLTMINTKGDPKYIIGYSSDGRYQWVEEGVCQRTHGQLGECDCIQECRVVSLLASKVDPSTDASVPVFIDFFKIRSHCKCIK